MKRCAVDTKRYDWLVLLVITILHASQCAPHIPQVVTPDIIVDHLSAAAEHIAAGEYTAAESIYREAIQIAPDDPRPLLKLADLYLLWQRPQAGLSALDEALRHDASMQESDCASTGDCANAVAILRLKLLALAGDWPQITIEAAKHLRAYPNDGEALRLLTQAYLQNYQCIAATTMAKRWHEAKPDDRDAVLTWSSLTSNTLLLCETDTRLRETAFCTQTGDGIHSEMELAAALIRGENWPLAACVLSHIAAPTHAREAVPAETYTWLGEALRRMGRPDEAQAHLITATTLAPEAPLGWLLLGTHYLNQQKTDAAREALLRTRALDPHNPALYLALAEATAQAGHYDEIEVWIAAALDKAPTDVDIAKAAAYFYLERHLIHEEYPFRAIQSAIQLAPDDGEAQMLLGQFRLMTGDYTGALPALDAAVKLDPSLGQAHYLRGLALQATGKPTEAQQAFIHAADLGYWP